MLKKIITITAFTLYLTAYAQASSIYKVNTKTSYKINYSNQALDLKGNYFPQEFLITLQKDLYQKDNKTIANAMRNIFTAYHKKEIRWIKENSIGNKKILKPHMKKYLKVFKDNYAHMYGYAMYDNYVIVFLKQKEVNNKLIFVLEKNKYNDYKISLDFENFHPNQFKIIEEAYKGKGAFVIRRKK